MKEYIVINITKSDKNYTLRLAPRNYWGKSSTDFQTIIDVKNPKISEWYRDHLCMGDRVLYDEESQQIDNPELTPAKLVSDKMLVTGTELIDKYYESSAAFVKRIVAFGNVFGELSFTVYPSSEFYYTNRGDVLLISKTLDEKPYIEGNLTMAKMRQDFLINQR